MDSGVPSWARSRGREMLPKLSLSTTLAAKGWSSSQICQPGVPWMQCFTGSFRPSWVFR